MFNKAAHLILNDDPSKHKQKKCEVCGEEKSHKLEFWKGRNWCKDCCKKVRSGVIRRWRHFTILDDDDPIL